jgi:hypothetical protein
MLLRCNSTHNKTLFFPHTIHAPPSVLHSRHARIHGLLRLQGLPGASDTISTKLRERTAPAAPTRSSKLGPCGLSIRSSLHEAILGALRTCTRIRTDPRGLDYCYGVLYPHEPISPRNNGRRRPSESPGAIKSYSQLGFSSIGSRSLAGALANCQCKNLRRCSQYTFPNHFSQSGAKCQCVS